MGADMRKLDSLAADPDWNGIFHAQPAAPVLRDELRRAVSHHTRAFGSTGTLARTRAARPEDCEVEDRAAQSGLNYYLVRAAARRAARE